MFEDFAEYGDWEWNCSDADVWEDEQVFQDQFAEVVEEHDDGDTMITGMEIGRVTSENIDNEER
jgi:hypothetical protein